MKALATVCAVVLGAVLLAAAAWAGTSYPPIPPGPSTVLPDVVGAAATPQPVSVSIPQNPSLAPNPFSSLHNDRWNSDVFGVWAPLGSDPQVFSSTLGASVLGGKQMTTSMAVDTYGRLVAIAIDSSGSYLLLIDPESLEVLCSKLLGAGSRQAIGSAYWYLDPQDRVTVVSGTDKIMTVREGGTLSQPELDVVSRRQYDLSTVDPSPIPDGDKLNGIMADWKGRIWFPTAGATAAPRVGVIDPATWPKAPWAQLGTGAHIWNGFAVTEHGAYALTLRKLYRLRAGSDDRPRIVWSALYKTSGKTPPGQCSLGSGTSPAILGDGKYVAIADNAAQIHMVVYRTAARLKPGQAVESSLLGASCSLIAENNYGHSWSFNQNGDMSSTGGLPGLERVDIKKDGTGLVKVWENDEVASMTTPKLSTKTSLVYLLARARRPDGRRRFLLDGRRLPHRQGGLAEAGRRRPGLRQLLGGAVGRPQRRHLRGRLRRSGLRQPPSLIAARPPEAHGEPDEDGRAATAARPSCG